MFVVAELQLAAQLFQMIHSTLVTLHAAIKGPDSLPSGVRQTMWSIRENQVPLAWRKLWSGPRTVIEFIRASIARGIAAERRYRSDGAKSFGSHINFGEIFNLEGFMSALKLTNAKYRCARCFFSSAHQITKLIISVNCRNLLAN